MRYKFNYRIGDILLLKNIFYHGKLYEKLLRF